MAANQFIERTMAMGFNYSRRSGTYSVIVRVLSSSPKMIGSDYSIHLVATQAARAATMQSDIIAGSLIRVHGYFDEVVDSTSATLHPKIHGKGGPRDWRTWWEAEDEEMASHLDKKVPGLHRFLPSPIYRVFYFWTMVVHHDIALRSTI